jgi:hypothetical protein
MKLKTKNFFASWVLLFIVATILSYFILPETFLTFGHVILRIILSAILVSMRSYPIFKE